MTIVVLAIIGLLCVFEIVSGVLMVAWAIVSLVADMFKK